MIHLGCRGGSVLFRNVGRRRPMWPIREQEGEPIPLESIDQSTDSVYTYRQPPNPSHIYTWTYTRGYTYDLAGGPAHAGGDDGRGEGGPTHGCSLSSPSRPPASALEEGIRVERGGQLDRSVNRACWAPRGIRRADLEVPGKKRRRSPRRSRSRTGTARNRIEWAARAGWLSIRSTVVAAAARMIVRIEIGFAAHSGAVQKERRNSIRDSNQPRGRGMERGAASSNHGYRYAVGGSLVGLFEEALLRCCSRPIAFTRSY